MSLKRRRFLILGGLSSLGLGFFWKTLWSKTAPSAAVNPALPKQLATPSTSVGKDLSVGATTEAQPLLRFISVADTGTGDKGQYAVAQAMTHYHSQNPFDLAILAGDNIYNNGEIEKIGAVFEKPYQSLLEQNVNFHACLGNHDIRTANGEPQVQYSGFHMEGRYYTFRRGPVQFFALDTNGNGEWQKQLAWLKQELSHSDAPWKMVFGHHPIYSSGLYGVNPTFVKTLTPLFQKYGVQLYINGHDHDYERTQPIKGTTYLVCGAGAGLRPMFHSKWTAHAASKLSFAGLEVYDNHLVIRGIGTDNQVFDKGIIQLSQT